MSHGSKPEGVVQLALSSALEAYLQRVRELGAVEGQNGAVELSPTLQPIVEAMHHVLAGGEVEVHVVRGGQPDLFEELRQRAARAIAETNALNQPAGPLVVTAV